MAENGNDSMHKVERYSKLVLIYEELDEKIDQLIMANDGMTEKMSRDDRARYRELARQRDDVLNEMRLLEHQLRIDGDDAEQGS